MQLKTWEYGKGGHLKSDSYWQDDRYNPTKYSHPHRYDNVNFPDQEYKDIFGGTLGNQEEREKQFYKLDLQGISRASVEHDRLLREKKALEAVAAPADAHNGHAPEHH